MIANRLQELEQSLNDGNIVKIRCTDKLNALKKDYSSKKKELQELGIDVAKAGEDIENKKKLLQEKIDNAFKMLPKDVIDRYKNSDFTTGVIDNEEKEEGRPF